MAKKGARYLASQISRAPRESSAERLGVRHMWVAPEVAEAVSADVPVVALESTLISHGLPEPHNLMTARAAEQAVRDYNAVPATIGVIDGQLIVGMDERQLQRLAEDPDVVKVSRRDLALALFAKKTAATTVAATMLAAKLAGIKVFATGGIGGVHRQAELSFDISADLTELSRTEVVVVCSGAKAILDIGRTCEVLETLGVPIIGYRTDFVPGFWTRKTEFAVDQRIDDIRELGSLMEYRRSVWATGGVVLCNPLPGKYELPRAQMEKWIAQAMGKALAAKVAGKKVTPFLLDELGRLSKGRTITANIGLITANAALAAKAAIVLAEHDGQAAGGKRAK